jgi:hypothetical protein
MIMLHAYRKIPSFRKTTSPEYAWDPRAEPLGCGWSILIFVALYYIFFAIDRVINKEGSKLDQVICYSTLTCLVILIILGIRDSHRESKAKQNARLNWAAGCKTAQLTILGRGEANSWWDDYAYKYRSSPNYLVLEMNADQTAVAPMQSSIRAEVHHYVFNRLKESSTVTIYYSPESPLTFLLKDEL